MQLRQLLRRNLFHIPIINYKPCLTPRAIHNNPFTSSAKLTDTESNEKHSLSTDDHLLLELDNRSFLILGVFHYDYWSMLSVENALRSYPNLNQIFIELCTERSDRIFRYLKKYLNKDFNWHTRDVETCVMKYAIKKKIPLICGDLNESMIIEKLQKLSNDEMMNDFTRKYSQMIIDNMNKHKTEINPNFMISLSDHTKLSNILWNTSEIKLQKNSETQSNELYFFIGDDTKEYLKSKDGKSNIVVKSRMGVREIMARDELLNDMNFQPIRDILYDEREKFMIRKLFECKGPNIIAVVGMAHLDGIEKYWYSDEFWKDRKYWMQSKMDDEKQDLENRLNWYKVRYGRWGDSVFKSWKKLQVVKKKLFNIDRTAYNNQ